jgi:acyl-CoA thioesterase
MNGTDAEQALAEHVVAAMMAKDAFSRWLGITVLEVRPRGASVRMAIRDEMVNGFGVSHGGIAYSLADSALAFASNTHGRVTVSIENAITYPAPVRVGDVLTAVAEEESASKRLAYYRVTIRRQDDTVVGLFRGTVYKTKTDFFAASLEARGDESIEAGK